MAGTGRFGGLAVQCGAGRSTDSGRDREVFAVARKDPARRRLLMKRRAGKPLPARRVTNLLVKQIAIPIAVETKHLLC